MAIVQGLANLVIIKSMMHTLSIFVCLTLDLMALQTKAGHQKKVTRALRFNHGYKLTRLRR